jgi:hypothetical protein
MRGIHLRSRDHLGLAAFRGALLGFCHLTIEDSVLNFLEQDIDPLGTKVANVDHQTASFLTKPCDQS